ANPRSDHKRQWLLGRSRRDLQTEIIESPGEGELLLDRSVCVRITRGKRNLYSLAIGDRDVIAERSARDLSSINPTIKALCIVADRQAKGKPRAFDSGLRNEFERGAVGSEDWLVLRSEEELPGDRNRTTR